MRVVVAPDKFRGSLSASEAARAIAIGVQRAEPSAEVIEVPMADGGEGTVEALVDATGGSFVQVQVTGPLGDLVTARYGKLGDGETAALEMATASGLALIPTSRRDPSRTTTRGTGELLLAAIHDGHSKIILGIGGSATNDGGAGFAQSLGFGLLDEQGRDLAPGGGALANLSRIVASDRASTVEGIQIAVACDVDNPLCGPEGASSVFGPQKGANPAMIQELDRNLAHFARIIQRDLDRDVAEVPGAGAAGGLGAGLMAFTSAVLEPGITLVSRVVGLTEKLEGTSLVFTGEGAIDRSSRRGKTAVGVARLARDRGIPVIALAGTIGVGASTVLNEGVDAYLSLCDRPMSLNAAVESSADLLTRIAEQAMRIFLAGRRSPS